MNETLTQQQIVEGLKLKSAAGNTFAQSLLSGFTKYRNFTPKQLPYAEKLAREALFPTAAPIVSGQSLGGSFASVIQKFNVAKQNGLKRPALTFNSFNGIAKIKIYPASETSANKGWLYVKGGELYFGKISPEGMFIKGRDANDAIVEFLKQIANDPVKFSAMHGRRTGCCCFCARELTTNNSVDAGYGPICADK